MTPLDGPHRVRTDVVVEAPRPDDVRGGNITKGEVRRAYASRFAPDAVIASVIGLVILLMGLIAVIRGGFTGSMSEPVIRVLGFTHTTTLGLIEVVLGAGLLASGASSSRSGSLFFGSVLGIAGFVGAVQTVSFESSLALESSLAWLAVFCGVIVVLSALLLPRFVRNTTSVEQIR
jgi:hypothetical protein